MIEKLLRARAAIAQLGDTIKADREMLHHYDEKYFSRDRKTSSLMGDWTQRIGFQMMSAVRLMQCLDEAAIPLAPKLMSRLIRHLYGSDIHWKTKIDAGVVLIHGMGLAISPQAKIGSKTIVFHHVTLGDGIDPDTGKTGAPTVGENVRIGPGATLLGPITIGAGSKIMAGAVVDRSVPPNSLVRSPPMVVEARKMRSPGVRPSEPDEHEQSTGIDTHETGTL